MYRMFAKEALEEIAQWRRRATSFEHQLDWRWIERYRSLASYDSYWWLTWAGPFTREEQQQWDHLFSSPRDETATEQLRALLKQSRERELAMAIAEQREPRLYYPAIEIKRYAAASLISFSWILRLARRSQTPLCAVSTTEQSRKSWMYSA